jgi:hypothetical protein
MSKSSPQPSSHRRIRGVVRHTGLAAGLVTLLSVGAACLFTAPSAFAQGGSSTTTSTPGSASIPLGSSNSDSATVTGTGDGDVAPTGTVAFYACGADSTGCTPSGSPFDTETLNGTDNPATVTTQTPFTPAAAGTWCFAAVYSGDSNYSGSSDETSDECFTVNGSTTVSKPGSSRIALSGTNTDSATVTGSDASVDPSGTVSFYECGPTPSAQPCTPTGSPFDTETLNGTSNPSTVTSVSITPSAAGIWCFAAVYSGDSNYPGSSDETTDECFTVTEAPSTTTSHPSGSPGVVTGHKAYDMATVTGNAALGAPTGSVTFYECGPSPSAQNCVDQVNIVGTVALTQGANDESTATSPAFVPTTAGTYCFGAYYSGDSNYLNSNDTTTDECFVVGPAPSVTSFSPVSGKPGAKVTINGKNLYEGGVVPTVTIGGVAAKALTYTATKITVKVPSGAKTGRIRVVTGVGPAVSKKNFKVT